MDPAGTASEPLDVMVTGATGFVGFHTTRALCEAGHRVSALVRSTEKARRVLEPAGLSGVTVIRGDITDERSVEEALEGRNAVVHSAAMVSVHARDADAAMRTNVRGAELVLGGAVEQGIERIVHVSSTTALFRPDVRVIDESSPLGNNTRGYGASKIRCERYVRDLQDRGAPIQITYPGSVIGPDDPGLSEAVAGVKGMVENRAVVVTTSGIQFIDVRDIAEAHRLLLERGGRPDLYLMGGHYLTWPDLADTLERVTGERFARFPMPAIVMRLLGRVLDGIDRIVRLEAPVSEESAGYATDWAVADDRHVKDTLALEYRPLEDSLRDTIDWLRDSGQLAPRWLPW